MDLVRHFPLAVVAKEVLFQQFGKLQRLFVLFPAADFLEKLRMEFLERLRLPGELLLKPLDGRSFAGDEDLKLQQLPDGHSLFVVPGGLFGKEVHAVPLRKALNKPGIEFRRGQGNGDAALDMEGHHAVEEKVVVTLGDGLRLAVPGDEDRDLPEVGADEIPDAVLRPRLQLESVFQPSVGFVCGNDEVLLDGGAGDLAVGPLLFVQRPDIGHDEPRRLHGFLYGVPDGVAGVVENDGHPAPRLEHPAIFPEASPHEILVFGQAFLFEPVHDGFGRGVGYDAMPRLHQKVQIGVVDVFAERRVGEDVVYGSVGKRKTSGCSGREYGGCFHRNKAAESLGEPIQLSPQVVLWATFGSLRSDIIYSCQILIYLGKMCRRIAGENRHTPDRLLHKEQQHVPDACVGVRGGLAPERGQGVRCAGQEEMVDVRYPLSVHPRSLMRHVHRRDFDSRHF